jgi:hypothetical protein
MDPAAEGVTADQPHNPKDEEDNRDSPKHGRSPEVNVRRLLPFAIDDYLGHMAFLL